MGERGPAPRREDERRRRNKPERPATKLGQEELNQLPFEVDFEPEPTELPACEPVWHPLVQRFWDDMQRDPARSWMTSGDWAATALFCEALSRELQEQVVGLTKEGVVVMAKEPPKGATLTAFLKLLEHIGVTESARLRIGREVTLFPKPTEPTPGDNVVSMADRRREAVQ